MFCNEDDELYFQVDYPLPEFANISDVPEALSTRIEEDLALLRQQRLVRG